MEPMDMGMPMAEKDPMMGNLTYLHVALFSAISGVLNVTRYHSSTHYTSGDTVLGDMNTWEYLGEFHHYSHAAVMTVLTITQILSMAGVAPEINIMAWMYVEGFEMVFGLIMAIANMYHYEKAYSASMSATGATATAGATMMAYVEEDAFDSMVESTASHLTLHFEHDNWMAAQILAMPEDMQKDYMHEKKEKKSDDMMMEFV